MNSNKRILIIESIKKFKKFFSKIPILISQKFLPHISKNITIKSIQKMLLFRLHSHSHKVFF